MCVLLNDTSKPIGDKDIGQTVRVATSALFKP